MEPALAASKLREEADRLVAQAKSMPPDHDTALTLLTADALVTLACELECQSKDGG